MEQEHLKDYVWMALGDEPPVQVPTDETSLTQKLAAGYHQVDEEPAEPATETKKEGE